MGKLRKKQVEPSASHGWRQRAVPIIGTVFGVAILPAVAIIANRLDTVWSIVFIASVASVLFPFAVFLLYISRKVRCPQCQSEQARLIYDDNGNEYLTCSDCGYRNETGNSLPND